MPLNTNSIHTLYAPGGKETANFGCYNGYFSVTVFSKDQRGPVTKMTFSPILITAMRDAFTKAMAGSPGTRVAIMKSNWNQDAKRSEPGTTIIIGKDDAMIIYFAIKDPAMAEPLRFPLSFPKSITVSSEEMDDAARSNFATKSFIMEILDRQVPMAIIGSRDAEAMKKTRTNFNGNSGGGNSGGGSYQSNANPGMPDDKNIPF